MRRRKILRRAARFVSHWEGFTPTAYKAFPHEVYLTIGYGHYGPDVKAGQTITKKGALRLLASDLRDSLTTVESLVTQRLSIPQAVALCSFTFNCGPGALAESTLLKRVNADAPAPDIRAAFLMWTKAGGVTLEGLVNRRKAEAALFNKR